MGAENFIFCAATLLGTQDVWTGSKWKVFLEEQQLTCTLVSNGIDAHQWV